jgi:diadenylate cyclase
VPLHLRQYLPGDIADWFQLAALVVVVYAVLRLVRGTIAASILRGTFILVTLGVIVAAFILRFFELRVLQSILSTLLGTLVIALLIVFQPELRRALLSLGEHSLLERFRHKPKTCVAVLAKTVVALSRERHGALFAVERRNALHHIVETGTRLDAEATPELLAGIFWPGAPLHDGGVVIRGDRAVAAGCIFPLAERRDIDSRLGTRHRAAIGLSETCDAVVIVVSEETGRVGVAVAGELRFVDPPTAIGPALEELTRPTKDDAGRAEPQAPEPAAATDDGRPAAPALEEPRDETVAAS